MSAGTLELILWICTAAMALLALSQVAGATPHVIAFVAQATTWFALAPSIPLAIVAGIGGWWPLMAVNVAIAGVLVWLTVPIVRRDLLPDPHTGDPRASLVFANTYFESTRPDDTAAALMDADADVLAMAEYTPEMEASLRAKGAFERYPYVVGRAEVTRDGIILLSRIPLASGRHADIGDVPGVDAVLDLDGVHVRVLVVHPLASVHARDLRSWRRDLRTYRRLFDAYTAAGERVIVVGDFNACRGHPDFRALVDRTAFRSAHEWLGRGFSTSWPIDGAMPAFVRIDHALVHGVLPTSCDDIDTPGSDHRAFELHFAAPRATRPGA